jgi:RNA polymerase sigma-70 factor (ECF subfamily)
VSATAVDHNRLLEHARGGSADAVGKLLDAYRAYLALLARLQINRQLRGKADASDLVQETFLAAHEHFPEFRGRTEEELLSWLRQIMASKLADLVRRYILSAGRAVRLERQICEDLDRSSCALGTVLEAGGSSPSHRATRREHGVLLANALQQLPDDYREVLVLRHLEELSFPEIADRMGRTLDSVKNLWTRSLARLKRILITT